MRILTSIFLFLFAPNFAAPLSARGGADDVKPAFLISRFQKASFSISAKVYYGDGDETEIPVKAEFYLLDESLVEILKEAKFNPVDETDQNTAGSGDGNSAKDEDYLEALSDLLTGQTGDAEENGLLDFLFWEAIKKHEISSVETDYFGYGKSGVIKSGNYYLFGYEQIEDETFIWNHQVWLSGGKEIEIDQNNAAIILPADF